MPLQHGYETGAEIRRLLPDERSEIVNGRGCLWGKEHVVFNGTHESLLQSRGTDMTPPLEYEAALQSLETNPPAIRAINDLLT